MTDYVDLFDVTHALFQSTAYLLLAKIYISVVIALVFE
jgi:hypothetical protein